ncbi:MAG: hypothetical protein JXA13_13050 [Anaerolineales bacterium]|nr:hypothetical protein [Anaerolineales bacterium]
MIRNNQNRIAPVLIVTGILLVLLSVFLDTIRGEAISIGFVQGVGLGLGGGIFLVGLNLVYARTFFYVSLALFVIGVVLLGFNLYGEFVSLRSPKLPPTLTPNQVFAEMDRRLGEPVEGYAYRLTSLIHEASVYGYWEIPESAQYNVRIPIHENFILWYMSFSEPNVFERYYFCDPLKAIERGASICRQATMVVEAIWKANGLQAREMTLDGHTVTELIINHDKGIRWVSDPLYGVVIEHDVSTLAEHPEIVQAVYMEAGLTENEVDYLMDLYGPDGNYIVTYKGYCQAEENIYRQKWTWPLYMTIPFLLVLAVMRIGISTTANRSGPRAAE